MATGTTTALDHPPGTYYDPIDGGATFDPDGNIVGLRQTAVAPPSIVELSGYDRRGCAACCTRRARRPTGVRGGR